MNKCLKYLQTWRFSFNVSQIMDTVESVNILGTIFQSSAKSETHIEERMKACRCTTFGLQGSGMLYPGLDTDVNAHLWRTMCCPTLTYGTDCLDKMESQQGTLVKQCIDVSKRNHHTTILNALEIQPLQTVIRQQTISLFSRMCNLTSK